MDILVRVLQLIASLSILVLVHEFGHFIFARIFHTRVEKFYLFFNPWFSLVTFQKINGKWQTKFFVKGKDEETDEEKATTKYGIGWLPLGGYVKISGMIDESMDKNQMSLPPQPYEFRSKPAWQRLFIMIGGVMVNFILAFVLYIFILFHYGDEYLPAASVKNGIMCVDSLDYEIGLQNGDKILAVGNKKIEDFHDIVPELLLNDPKTLLISRNGQEISLNVKSETIGKIIKQTKIRFSPRTPFIAASFSKESNAQKAGMLPDDKIIGIDTLKIEFFDEFKKYIANYKSKNVVLTVERNSQEVKLNVFVSKEGTIGVYSQIDSRKFFEHKREKYSFFQAIPAGIERGFVEVKNYLKQIKLIIFSPETKAYESVGGFGAIASIFPTELVIEIFWRLTALLSIMLAVVNLLPIPALDGGHVMFLLYEIISRRKPSLRVLEVAQIIGMILLFALLIYANGNDVMKLFR